MRKVYSEAVSQIKANKLKSKVLLGWGKIEAEVAGNYQKCVKVMEKFIHLEGD